MAKKLNSTVLDTFPTEEINSDIVLYLHENESLSFDFDFGLA